MFNKLFECIQGEELYEKIQRLKDIMGDLQELTAFFDSDIFKEECKDAAIDAICQILQNFKSKKESHDG